MLGLQNSITEPLNIAYKNNKSVLFDGIDTHIKAPAFSFTNHSISCWVLVNNTASNKTIIDTRDQNSDGILIFILGNEKLRYVINNSTLETSSAVSTDVFFHLVCTYNGTTAKIYINGSEVVTQNISQTVDTTNLTCIGARAFNTITNTFKGRMLQMTGYSRAISSAEVTLLYNSGVPVNPLLPFSTSGVYSTSNIEFCYLFGDCSLDNARFPLLGDAKNTSQSANRLPTFDEHPTDSNNYILGYYPTTNINANNALVYDETNKTVRITVHYPADNQETQLYKYVTTDENKVIIQEAELKTERANFARLHSNAGDSFLGSDYAPNSNDFEKVQQVYFTDEDSANGSDVFRFQGVVSSSLIGNTFSVEYTIKNPSLKTLNGKAARCHNMTLATNFTNIVI